MVVTHFRHIVSYLALGAYDFSDAFIIHPPFYPHKPKVHFLAFLSLERSKLKNNFTFVLPK